MSDTTTNLLGADDLVTISTAGLNGGNGSWNVPENSSIEGWRVGRRRAGSKGVDILGLADEGLANANQHIDKQASWAVRLWGLDSDTAGEISHPVPLEGGKKYTLTWYQAADIFKGQGGSENYTVYIDNQSGVIEPTDGRTASIITRTYSSTSGWNSETLQIDMTGLSNGTYYISFMGPATKYINQYRRGVLITNVRLTANDVDAKDIDIVLNMDGASIDLEKGKSNPQSLSFKVTNRGSTVVSSLSATASLTSLGGTEVRLQTDPYKGTVMFNNKQGSFVIHAGSLLAGDKVGTATLHITVGSVAKDFEVRVKDKTNWSLTPLQPSQNSSAMTISKGGTFSLQVKLIDESSVNKSDEQVTLVIPHNDGALTVSAGGGKTDPSGKATFILEGNKPTSTPVQIQVTHPRVPTDKWLVFPVTVSAEAPVKRYKFMVVDSQTLALNEEDIIEVTLDDTKTGEPAPVSVKVDVTVASTDTTDLAIRVNSTNPGPLSTKVSAVTPDSKGIISVLARARKKGVSQLTFHTDDAEDLVLSVPVGQSSDLSMIFCSRPDVALNIDQEIDDFDLAVGINNYDENSPKQISFSIAPHTRGGLSVWDATTESWSAISGTIKLDANGHGRIEKIRVGNASGTDYTITLSAPPAKPLTLKVTVSSLVITLNPSTSTDDHAISLAEAGNGGRTIDANETRCSVKVTPTGKALGAQIRFVINNPPQSPGLAQFIGVNNQLSTSGMIAVSESSGIVFLPTIHLANSKIGHFSVDVFKPGAQSPEGHFYFVVEERKTIIKLEFDEDSNPKTVHAGPHEFQPGDVIAYSDNGNTPAQPGSGTIRFTIIQNDSPSTNYTFTSTGKVTADADVAAGGVVTIPAMKVETTAGDFSLRATGPNNLTVESKPYKVK